MTPEELAAMGKRYAAARAVLRRDKKLSDDEKLGLLGDVVAPSAEVQLAEKHEAKRQKRLRRDERRRRRAT